MTRKLAIIAALGLAASAAGMGAAAAVGARNFGDGWDGLSLFDDRPRCEAHPGTLPANRELDWDDSDHAGLSVNGHASYAPGSDTKVHVSGDPQIVAHLRVRDGDIEMDCHGWGNRTKALTIVLPGRQFRKFDIAGGGNLVLDKLDQSALKIEIAGSGSVRANGRIDDLKLEVAGSGNADLDQITTRQTRIEIAGSGSVRASGSIDTLKMAIAGSGDADFDQLTAHHAEVGIAGSGAVRAKGGIDDLNIEIEGSGRADFGAVTTRTARVEIGGHGNVDIAPSEEANVQISGSGRIHRLGSGS